MLLRFTRVVAAVVVTVGLWALNSAQRDDGRAWVRPVGSPAGRVKILQFQASVGALRRGEKALLCYGVENAKSVRISPLFPRIDPSRSRCLEIGPEHTTHYTIMAEGFDGTVATRSLTVPVRSELGPPLAPLQYSRIRRRRTLSA
jgi:hypothetical protein